MANQDRLRVVGERVLHEGRSYDFVELSVDHPDGRRRTKPMVRHRGAACVVPILDGAGGPEIVLVRNDRVTIDRFLLEIPAGGIDPGEDPAVAAARELEEEAGYRAATVEPLGRFYTTPGLTDEMMHAFVARDLSFVGQRLEPYEVLTVEVMPWAELRRMLDHGGMGDGALIDGKTMLSLLLAMRAGVLPG
ncbi:MAG: NUDIX hydrolase [Planctomycetota bacterium]|nr:MAG: NUDIX hydrolase [Planctomycetota bacterium]